MQIRLLYQTTPMNVITYVMHKFYCLAQCAGKVTHRNDLQRVYELRDLLPDPVPPGAYFANFDETLTSYAVKKKVFLEIEEDLQGLDHDAWAFLKKELAPLLTAKDPDRGWQQLIDKLNQAKGYNHVKHLGCTDVRFIPESRMKGHRTPDIEAVDGNRAILCEVKTINLSNNEVVRFRSGGVGASADRLSEAFLGKLRSTVDGAEQQMLVYNADKRTRRIAYLVINFDDTLHEYADQYAPQLEEVAAGYLARGIEVVYDTGGGSEQLRPSSPHF
ncbi:hypothetical protein [Rhizobium sp. BK491]|uniref:hypothetical protein n=1 Tax=Rhizobium sp. BK491 TaxID=2587009 RepID=UPI00161EC3C7|nr:hypothetical protein [Rhizobium sp. BK491]MBB3571988.1 hypothetical protein [Rhizobium sp. BK491]